MRLFSESEREDELLGTAAALLRDAGIGVTTKECKYSLCLVTFGAGDIGGVEDARVKTLTDEQKEAFASYAAGSLIAGLTADGFDRMTDLFGQWWDETGMDLA